MEGILKVSPDRLDAAAQEFAVQGSSVSALIDQMNSLANTILQGWEGDAATVYVQKLSSLEGDIDLMNRMIQEHASNLQTMAASYRESENVTLESVNTLTTNIIS